MSFAHAVRPCPEHPPCCPENYKTSVTAPDRKEGHAAARQTRFAISLPVVNPEVRHRSLKKAVGRQPWCKIGAWFDADRSLSSAIEPCHREPVFSTAGTGDEGATFRHIELGKPDPRITDYFLCQLVAPLAANRSGSKRAATSVPFVTYTKCPVERYLGTYLRAQAQSWAGGLSAKRLQFRLHYSLRRSHLR